MRKHAFVAFFVLALAFPSLAQEYPPPLVQLLEERLKAMKRLQQEDCSPLVSAAARAGIRRTEESIRRLFPAVAAQFDRAGWPSIPQPEGESPGSWQETTPESTTQNPDSPSESPYAVSPIDAPSAPPLEETPQAAPLEDKDGALDQSETTPAEDDVSAETVTPLKPAALEFTKGTHEVSYVLTDTAEIMLGTYLPGDVDFLGGLYLFYYKNTSNRPVDISARNFTLVDQERIKAVKIKARAEVQARANPFLMVGKVFSGLLRRTSHPENRGTSLAHSDESNPNPANTREVSGKSSKATETSASSPGLDADYQARIAWHLHELSVNRSDWQYWMQARLLSEYMVKPGEEILRFVPTAGSDRRHRHLLRFKCGDTEAVLNSAEKGLH